MNDSRNPETKTGARQVETTANGERVSRALAEAPGPVAPPDEAAIQTKTAKGLTRPQAVEAIARQRHFDKHVAPSRLGFARSRPFRILNQ